MRLVYQCSFTEQYKCPTILKSPLTIFFYLSFSVFLCLSLNSASVSAHFPKLGHFKLSKKIQRCIEECSVIVLGSKYTAVAFFLKIFERPEKQPITALENYLIIEHALFRNLYRVSPISLESGP